MKLIHLSYILLAPNLRVLRCSHLFQVSSYGIGISGAQFRHSQISTLWGNRSLHLNHILEINNDLTDEETNCHFSSIILCDHLQLLFVF